MEFIETSVFTRQITELLTDAEYEQLQRVLLLYPLAGDLIKHSGGLRKLRFKAKGKGKRGGISIAINNAMMAITTKSSINVKPCLLHMAGFPAQMEYS